MSLIVATRIGVSELVMDDIHHVKTHSKSIGKMAFGLTNRINE